MLGRLRAITLPAQPALRILAMRQLRKAEHLESNSRLGKPRDATLKAA
jgi:hypothetical protein